MSFFPPVAGGLILRQIDLMSREARNMLLGVYMLVCVTKKHGAFVFAQDHLQSNSPRNRIDLSQVRWKQPRQSLNFFTLEIFFQSSTEFFIYSFPPENLLFFPYFDSLFHQTNTRKCFYFLFDSSQLLSMKNSPEKKREKQKKRVWPEKKKPEQKPSYLSSVSPWLTRYCSFMLSNLNFIQTQLPIHHQKEYNI